MWIVAIAWIYVVGLMALTEASAVAGIMTFFGYCVLPLSLLYYITGSKRRRARRAEAQRQGGSDDTSSGFDSLPALFAASSDDSDSDCGSDSGSDSDSSSCSDSGGGDSGGGD